MILTVDDIRAEFETARRRSQWSHHGARARSLHPLDGWSGWAFEEGFLVSPNGDRLTPLSVMACLFERQAERVRDLLRSEPARKGLDGFFFLEPPSRGETAPEHVGGCSEPSLSPCQTEPRSGYRQEGEYRVYFSRRASEAVADSWFRCGKCGFSNTALLCHSGTV